MNLRIPISAIAILALCACSSEVDIPNQSSGAGGSGSGAGTGGSTSVSASAGAGGSSVCAETHDTMDVTFSSFDSITYTCKGEWGLRELNARVVKNPGDGSLVLDSCSPAADCIPFISTLTMTAPGLSIPIPEGTYIHAQIYIQAFMGGCAQRVQIDNLPVWDGDPNPVDPSALLWVLAADGDTTTFMNSPVDVSLDPLGCFPDEPPGCGEHEDYSWHFRPAKSPDAPGIVVPMGETTTWTAKLPDGPGLLRARNLRSFALGYCDGPVDMAYWITAVLTKD